MTRININIHPQALADQHLLAEHREIIRIPNHVATKNWDRNKIPASFTLGTGHVRFFYDKIGYLKTRYLALYAECRERGFNVSDMSSAFEPFEGLVEYNHEPNFVPGDRVTMLGRLYEKIDVMKYPRYRGNPIDRPALKTLLNKIENKIIDY